MSNVALNGRARVGSNERSRIANAHLERTRLLWPAVLAALAGCASAAPAAPVQEPSAEPAPVASDSVPRARPLAPATALEREIASELEQFVTALAGFGERNVDHPLGLADATDWVHQTLEGYGLSVSRQGFSVGDEVQQNLVVHFAGARRGDHSVVVGARLDSPLGSVGSDDNASGAAALLCIAKHLERRRALRSVDLVWFSDAGMRRDPQATGVGAFLKDVERRDVKVTAMIELHGLGVFSDRAGSQHGSEIVPLLDPFAQFIALVSYPEHAVISDHFNSALVDTTSVPVRRVTAFSDAPSIPGTLHDQFLHAGYPAMLIYDTHGLRYPEFGGAQDTPDRLDFPRMGRVVAGIVRALPSLMGPSTEIDEPGEDAPASSVVSGVAGPELPPAGGAPAGPAAN